MSENERQEVIPICKTFHTSAKQLSQRYDMLLCITFILFKGKVHLEALNYTVVVCIADSSLSSVATIM